MKIRIWKPRKQSYDSIPVTISKAEDILWYLNRVGNKAEIMAS